ncbi:MotA/TolQ/ExbB proton channel family protein [Candidatus Poribacteria bacterium]|nr:MotA/TolQ/ExbB proton channel family protein [Candidatus Poribacteria bacterium]
MLDIYFQYLAYNKLTSSIQNMINAIIDGIKQIGQGGVLMIPLLFCSLFTHAIILERFYNLRRGKLMPRIFISRIYKVIEKGNLDMAVSLCESKPGPLTKIIKVAIENRHLDKDGLMAVLNMNSKVEKAKLQKYLRVLAFLGALSVLIGLLGTAVGIYISLGAVWRTDRPDTASTVARGISFALITTAAGLMVALPAILGYAYFMVKSDRMISDITKYSFSLVRYFTTGDSRVLELETQDMDRGN